MSVKHPAPVGLPLDSPDARWLREVGLVVSYTENFSPRRRFIITGAVERYRDALWTVTVQQGHGAASATGWIALRDDPCRALRRLLARAAAAPSAPTTDCAVGPQLDLFSDCRGARAL